MDVIHPRRIHPGWDFAVFVWITLFSAGLCVLRMAEISLWILLAAGTAGVLSLLIICGRFPAAQGRDIFLLTENSVPKGKIAGRFLLEFTLVLLLSGCVGTILGVYAFPVIEPMLPSAGETAQEETEERNFGDFSGFGDFSAMPENAGERGGQEFSFEGMPEGMPEGMTEAMLEGMTEGRSEREGETAEGFDRESMQSFGEGAERPDFSEDTERPSFGGNSGKRQNSEQIQQPFDTEPETTAAETAAPLAFMGIVTALYIALAALALTIGVWRYNPYDEWEWKYEYAD